MKTLENRFESDLINKMNIAKKQCKYYPTRFLQTLHEMGGVATAKRLIEKARATGKQTDGFTRLFLEGRLDLTMEASVVEEQYRQLFTDDEIAYCRDSLQNAGYNCQKITLKSFPARILCLLPENFLCFRKLQTCVNSGL